MISAHKNDVKSEVIAVKTIPFFAVSFGFYVIYFKSQMNINKHLCAYNRKTGAKNKVSRHDLDMSDCLILNEIEMRILFI